MSTNYVLVYKINTPGFQSQTEGSFFAQVWPQEFCWSWCSRHLMYIAYRYIVRMLFPVFSKCWEIWTKPAHVWPVASIIGKCCDWTAFVTCRTKWHLWLNHIPNRRFTFTMFVICLSCFSRGKQGIGCLPKKSLADELLEELGMKELKKLGLTGLTGLTQSQSQSHPNDRMHAG